MALLVFQEAVVLLRLSLEISIRFLDFSQSNSGMFSRLLCLAFYVFVYFSNELKLQGLIS